MTHLQGLSQSVVAFDIGLRLVCKRQSLRSVDGRGREGFAVDEAMEQIQHMGLGRNTALQRHLHGAQHGLLVVLKDKCQNVDHLAIAASLLEQMLLQGSECIGKFGKGCSVAKGAWFALYDSQIVPPVIDRLPWPIMRSIDDAAMLADDQTFRGNHDTIWIDP
jgi:hypothetical protein